MIQIVFMQRPIQNQSNLQSLPMRRKEGIETKFRKIVVECNRFKVDVSKLSFLCIFALKFTPDIKQEQKSKRQQIINKITPQIETFIHCPIFKDGLIFSHRLPETKDKTILCDQYVVTIRQIKRFDAKSNTDMLLYFLGNVMRKIMEKLGYVEISNTKKFIDVNKYKDVQNVMVYTGFKVNFELLQNGYFLTVDSTKKIVRNQSVLDHINFIIKSNQTIERDQRRQIVRKSLINSIIMTNYGKSRYVRVDDVLFIDLTTIVVQSYKMLLPEYYRVKYDIDIKYLKQPLLLANSKKEKKTYLVPQLCLMTGIPDNFEESKNKMITQSARGTPDKRKNQIQNFVKDMNKRQGDLIFPVLGVKIQAKCEKIQAQIIPAPKIFVGDNRTIPSGRQANFSMQQIGIYKYKQLIKLGIITFENVDYTALVQYFSKTFKILKMKIQISIIKSDNHEKSYCSNNVLNFIQMAKQKQNCTLCLVIIPNKMSHLYPKIKQKSLLQKQLGCQVVLQKTLKNKNVQSVALKILLQILAKAGSTLWASVPQHKKQKIMIIGYYSTEIAKTKNNVFLIGICATCNDLHTQIFSKTSKYNKESQELHIMKQLLFQALGNYKKKNGYSPQNIIILQNQKPYRTQSSTIQFYIQPSIQMMEQFYGLKRPKIVCIWLRKALNDRFFRNSEGRYINPPIGTLINGAVTLNKNDFYLVAHNIINSGSATLTNYKIIYSDSQLQCGFIQSLLFSQCFNYANYTGAIKIPAIIQYVTKCTKFGAEVLSKAQIPQKFRMYPYYL